MYFKKTLLGLATSALFLSAIPFSSNASMPIEEYEAAKASIMEKYNRELGDVRAHKDMLIKPISIARETVKGRSHELQEQRDQVRSKIKTEQAARHEQEKAAIENDPELLALKARIDAISTDPAYKEAYAAFIEAHQACKMVYAALDLAIHDADAGPSAITWSGKAAVEARCREEFAPKMREAEDKAEEMRQRVAGFRYAEAKDDYVAKRGQLLSALRARQEQEHGQIDALVKAALGDDFLGELAAQTHGYVELFNVQLKMLEDSGLIERSKRIQNDTFDALLALAYSFTPDDRIATRDAWFTMYNNKV